MDFLDTRTMLNDKNIEISIDTLHNVIKKEDINVVIVVEHNGVVLGESDSVLVKATCDDEAAVCDIDFVTYLPVIKDDEENVHSIVSTPLLITVLYSNVENEDDLAPTDNDSKRQSILATISGSIPTEKILGICNLDVIPIILGERCFTEKLILETPNFSYGGSFISWQNLPQLAITVSQDSIPIFETDVNFLNMTVESVFNLPDNFTDNLEYKIGTVVYVNSEIPDNVVFQDGTWTKYRDIERTKRWKTLCSLKNRARLSKYKMDCDYMGVKNEFKQKVNLAKIARDDTPRIEWNAVHRCILWRFGIEQMQNHIRRYKYWPFQFVISEKSPARSTKGSPSPKPQIYQCYIDFTELLFPGKKKCRVVGQLYTFNPTDITAKVGIEKNIFDMETKVKETKNKEQKKKSPKEKSVSVTSEPELVQSEAITSANGEPTVVVIEIELYEPLIACRALRDFMGLLEDIIPKREDKPPYAYSGEVAEAQYMNSIKRLAEVLTESYRDFQIENNKNSEPCFLAKDKKAKENVYNKYSSDSQSDELTCFTQYLYRSGTYMAVRSTLRAKVTLLLDQKFQTPAEFVDNNTNQNFISSVYTYLVEQMHIAINTMVEGRNTEKLPPTVDSKSVSFYAEEAFELGYFDKARDYYTKIIAGNKKDPVSWIKYAIFLKKIRDMERAKQACLEAITLNRRDPIALLVYAAILFEERNYREAELFVKAITDMYPRFYEAWVTLHLFYVRTEYYPGIDVAYRTAAKCMLDKNRQIRLDERPLCWTMIHCPPDNMYMTTATFLFKLHLCELAEIALAQELAESGWSIHLFYYMAVEHYLCGRFEDALSHLQEARCNYGMDYSISSLMGHCYFNIGDNAKAIEYYDFAQMLFDRPRDLHLVHLRLGQHYYNTREFKRAKKKFLNVCSSSPSPQSWLGAGLSYYELQMYKEAETSLSEANRLDNTNPDIWGYLCLLNITLNRHDEFSQCYREMVKNNLKNRELWLRITNMMETMDYAPPVLVVTNNNSIEEMSEEQLENGNDT